MLCPNETPGWLISPSVDSWDSEFVPIKDPGREDLRLLKGAFPLLIFGGMGKAWLWWIGNYDG